MKSAFFDEFTACGKITVRVIPNAPKSQVEAKMADGRWKIRLKAPAHSGQANQALLKLLEEQIGFEVQILAGVHAREKVLGLKTISSSIPALLFKKS